MEIYLVGGAVRDTLLGIPVNERDWVVVGSSPEEMIELGYKQVGSDFPVFLSGTPPKPSITNIKIFDSVEQIILSKYSKSIIIKP